MKTTASMVIETPINSKSDSLPKEWMSNLWKNVFLTRKIDEKMAILAKQNKGSTFFLSSAGHELVGALFGDLLLKGVDWAFPYYRDRAFTIAFGGDLVDLFASFLTRDIQNHSGGRMMPDHFSDRSRNIPCQSSCVGSQFLQAVGRALGLKLDQSPGIVYVSAGDGATSQGDFHEALNFATIHKLPILFVIQDNGYAISTTRFDQTSNGNIAKMGKAHDVLTFKVDGTQAELCHQKFSEAIAYVREKKGPALVVADVPRLNSHTCSDDQTKYRSSEELEKEKARDPLVFLENLILKQISSDVIQEQKKEILKIVEKASSQAEEIPFPKKESATTFVYKEFTCPESQKPSSEKQPVVMFEAINHALVEEMQNNPYVLVFGEDVAKEKGGVFGITRGLTEKFGLKRCFNTPLAESTIIGVAMGLSLDGKYRPVVEIPYADYVWPAMNQLVNELASIYYRSKGEWFCPVTIRMPTGGYIQGGPYHSQSLESILAHMPGLKIAIPSNAEDAKRLLKTAIHDPNPVLFLEHKALYRQKKFSFRPEPGEKEFLEFGKAQIVHEGKDLTVVTYGYTVHLAHTLAEKLAKENISIEVIDLRTLIPLDWETLKRSLKKTGKLLISHEASKTCGFAAEISAKITEEVFHYLDAPIIRVCGKDTPVPFCLDLEREILPQMDDLEREIRKLLAF